MLPPQGTTQPPPPPDLSVPYPRLLEASSLITRSGRVALLFAPPPFPLPSLPHSGWRSSRLWPWADGHMDALLHHPDGTHQRHRPCCAAHTRRGRLDRCAALDCNPRGGSIAGGCMGGRGGWEGGNGGGAEGAYAFLDVLGWCMDASSGLVSSPSHPDAHYSLPHNDPHPHRSRSGFRPGRP